MTKIIAVVALVVLEVTALLKNLDGTYFSLVIATIAGIVGYEVAKRI